MSLARWMAAAAALVLIMAGGMVGGGPAMLQASTACTAQATAPSPPTGVRIVADLLGLNDNFGFNDNVPSGPNAGPDAADLVAAAATSSSQDYFDSLAERADCQAAYGLRTDAQIGQYRHGRGLYAVQVNYDPAMDAAKWQWNYNDLSAENIRLPIRLERPSSGTSKILIVSDHMWDSAWLTEYKDASGRSIGGWKWLQVTSGSGADNPRQRIWFEPQMRAIGDNPFSRDNPPVLSLFDAREYLGVQPPTTNVNATACGVNFGEAIGPMLSCFKAYANTWTRTWIELKLTAGDAYTEISWWMADENHDAVPILLNARQNSYPPHTEFWFEYNTSAETRVGGPMAAWGRNVVVLKDVADPSTVFARPTR